MTEKKFYNLLERRKNFPGDESIREQLRPYKVDNAIIMAAGMSSRFVPLSLEKPKGLLEVRGEVLIERQIRQLQVAGIDDITVVVGYKKEMFFYLEEQFKVKIVVNPDYYRYNNTSTLMLVLPLLKNTYICSSDNYFVDNVFEEYVYQSYYAAVFAEGETNEYCLRHDDAGRIIGVDIGGRDAWYMLGHVYFDRNFSDKFRQILQHDYTQIPDVRNQLWEDVYAAHVAELPLYIRKYAADQVKEFDSLDELRSFDESYLDNLNSAIMDNIVSVLQCSKGDIKEIYPIKSGMTNISFYFSCLGRKYVYRHPGEGTEKYINRANEAFAMQKASELGMDNTFIYMDAEEGWKISHYIEDARILDYHNSDDVKQAMQLVRRLHEAK
ncbi:MAG: NTP transferase domain-containing protein, partial [Anaerovibrio sp.]|uniref:NTP transferase domain-containing protein n=1 Tax=Anaerovibrio sp. TaxID=1872532 RepID=UPI002E778333